jgi:hypothetical protein
VGNINNVDIRKLRHGQVKDILMRHNPGVYQLWSIGTDPKSESSLYGVVVLLRDTRGGGVEPYVAELPVDCDFTKSQILLPVLDFPHAYNAMRYDSSLTRKERNHLNGIKKKEFEIEGR